METCNMAFAHLVYQAPQQATEFIRLSRQNRSHNLRAVYTLLPGGTQTGRVNLTIDVSNTPFFQNLAKSISQGTTSFQFTPASGRMSTVTAKPIRATRMTEFTTSTGISTIISIDNEDEPEAQASVGAVAAVAIVAILVIGGMAAVKMGGSFKGEASQDSESSSVSVEAEAGGEGEGDGGGEEGGNGEGGQGN